MNVLRLHSTTEILSSFLETSTNFSFTSAGEIEVHWHLYKTVGRYFVLFVVEIVLVGDPLATTEKGKSTPSSHTYFCPVLAHKPLTVIRRGHMTTSSWKSSMVYEAISSFPDFPDFSNPTYEALHVCYWLFGSDIKILEFRYHSRFFVQVGHETTYASSGNKHFFTKSCHCQTYQNY